MLFHARYDAKTDTVRLVRAVYPNREDNRRDCLRIVYGAWVHSSCSILFESKPR